MCDSVQAQEGGDVAVATTTTTTFDDILRYVPAVNTLTSYLELEDLKSLSETTTNWWGATNKEMVERVTVKARRGSTMWRPYKRYNVCDNDVQYSELYPPNHLPLEHLRLSFFLITPRIMHKFPNLKSLEANYSFINEGCYAGIRDLTVRIPYNLRPNPPKMTHDNAVFKDLVNLTFIMSLTAPRTILFLQMCTFLRNHPSLRSFELVVRGSVVTEVLETLENHTRLEKLALTCHECRHDNPCLDLSLGNIARINRLNLSSLVLWVECNDITALNLKNLHTFKMGSFELGDDMMRRWLPYSKKMKSFRLSNMKNSSYCPLVVLAKRFSNLQRLHLHYSLFQNFSTTDVAVFPKLKSLKLINTRGLCNVLAPQLETLRLDGRKLTDEDLTHIGAKFPKLTKLEVYYFRSDDDIARTVYALPNCTSLTFLSCSAFNMMKVMDFLENYARDNKYTMIKRKHSKRKAVKRIQVGRNVYCFYYLSQ